jgi:hypothetical protein
MKTANLRSSALVLAIGYLLSAISASAHPGHRLGEHGATHIVSSPYHLAMLALGGAMLWLTGRFVQRQLPRRFLQGAGIAAVLTAALIWGVRT